MYKIKAFKKTNLVLGILSGSLSKDELNEYANELVRTIEKKLLPGFSYMLDITKSTTEWHENNPEIDEKMNEIVHFLNMMGLESTYIIGASRNVYDAHKNNDKSKKPIFFSNIDEAFEFLKRNRQDA